MTKKVLITSLFFFLLLLPAINTEADPLDSSEVDLHMIIGGHAELEIISSHHPGDLIEFGEIEGKPGVYWVNGWRFNEPDEHPRGLAEAHTDGLSWTEVEHNERAGGHSEDGRFMVRTNTNIYIEFNWQPHENLSSPMFFALYCPEQDGYVHWFGSGDVQDSEGNELESFSQFAQDAGTEREWHIDSAIYIQEVHQQAAGNYDGEIVVTIAGR